MHLKPLRNRHNSNMSKSRTLVDELKQTFRDSTEKYNLDIEIVVDVIRAHIVDECKKKAKARVSSCYFSYSSLESLTGFKRPDFDIHLDEMVRAMGLSIGFKEENNGIDDFVAVGFTVSGWANVASQPATESS